MSEPRSIGKLIVKSGGYTGTVSELRHLVHAGIAVPAAERAVAKTINQLAPSVAKKTGLLRRVYRQSGRIHTTPKRITAMIDIKQVKREVTYAEYQVLAPDGKRFGRVYKKPTTPGTRPISSREARDKLLANVKTEFKKRLRKHGIKSA